MTDSEQLLLDAGVPETLWSDKDKTVEYLARKVIALSEQVGADTVVIDESRLREIENRVFESISALNNIDVFKQYNKSYLLTLSEIDRVATKAALIRFANERNVQPSDYWM